MHDIVRVACTPAFRQAFGAFDTMRQFCSAIFQQRAECPWAARWCPTVVLLRCCLWKDSLDVFIELILLDFIDGSGALFAYCPTIMLVHSEINATSAWIIIVTNPGNEQLCCLTTAYIGSTEG